MLTNITNDSIKALANEYIDECEFSSGIILLSSISPIDEMVKASELNINYKKNKTRFILIGRSKLAGYPGRMKVSRLLPFNKSPQMKNHENTISFYITNEKTMEVQHTGDIRNFDFGPGELEMYDEICRRNWNLIMLAKNDGIEEDLERCLIEDENRRFNGIDFIRDKDGNLIINTQIRNEYGASCIKTMVYDIRGNLI